MPRVGSRGNSQQLNGGGPCGGGRTRRNGLDTGQYLRDMTRLSQGNERDALGQFWLIGNGPGATLAKRTLRKTGQDDSHQSFVEVTLMVACMLVRNCISIFSLLGASFIDRRPAHQTKAAESFDPAIQASSNPASRRTARLAFATGAAATKGQGAGEGPFAPRCLSRTAL